MAFDDREGSNYHGAPVSLYQFNIGSHWWHYASSVSPVIVGNTTYEPLTISDEGFVVGGTTQQEDVTITLDASAGVVALFTVYPPSSPVYVVVRRKHVFMDDVPVLWVGTISAVKRKNDSTAILTCTPLTGSLNRAGLRLPWSRFCPHVLYDRNCRVNPVGYRFTVMVADANPRGIIAPGLIPLPAGFLSGGMIEWELMVGVTERRGIESNAGDVAVIMGSALGLAAGMVVTVYAGCDRNYNTCRDKFNNVPNFGGSPWMPGKSPFDGDRVF